MEEPRLAERRPRRLYIEDVEKITLEYDKQSDILYIHFTEGDEEADEAFMTENDIVVRVKGDRILDIMVMEFSRKSGYQC